MSDQIARKAIPILRRSPPGLLHRTATWLGRVLSAANRHIANGVPSDKFSWTVFM